MVPKRQARRAVTRNLIKRAMREALQRLATELPPGLWVLRLRGTFAKEHYPSASSRALDCAVRDELARLLERCVIAPTGPSHLGATP